MRVEYTGRHIEITEPIRQFAQEHLQRLRGLVEDVIEVHFILTVEKHQRHVAEANIKTRNGFYHGQEVTTDMYTSIAAVVDKIEKQVLKSKEKHLARKRRAGNGSGYVEAGSVAEVEEVLQEHLPRLVRTNELTAKPMSVEEAVADIDDSERHFLVFRNAHTERLNVVYKRKDGDIGWIDPHET